MTPDPQATKGPQPAPRPLAKPSSEPLLALSRVHFPVTALGPGRRVAIWFQGCSLHCPGCVSPETWAFEEPKVSVSSLAESLSPYLERSDGVTVTGGEPLEQPQALAALLRLIRARSGRPLSVLLFTGWSRGKAIPAIKAFSPLVDAAICGPFEEALPQTLPLRGSDNQTLHLLTPLGAKEFSRYSQAAKSARAEPQSVGRLDFMFGADGTAWFAGIPKRGDMARLRILAESRQPQRQPLGPPQSPRLATEASASE